MNENKIEMVWTKADFERVCGRPLTDKEWEVLASEVESDLEELIIPEVIQGKFDVVDHLVEQDQKYEDD